MGLLITAPLMAIGAVFSLFVIVLLLIFVFSIIGFVFSVFSFLFPKK